MKLREVMTQNVEIAELTMNLQEAAFKMKMLNVGSLPVHQEKPASGFSIGMTTRQSSQALTGPILELFNIKLSKL
jgi:hypothetical protein